MYIAFYPGGFAHGNFRFAFNMTNNLPFKPQVPCGYNVSREGRPFSDNAAGTLQLLLILLTLLSRKHLF